MYFSDELHTSYNIGAHQNFDPKEFGWFDTFRGVMACQNMSNFVNVIFFLKFDVSQSYY